MLTIEVVGPLGVVLLARDVEEEVGRESENLLADEHVESVKRGVSEVMLVVDLLAGLLVREVEVGAGFGDVDLVLFHGGMVGVVAMVGDSPGEEGSPHRGVGDEANDVADKTAIREGTMTSLVADNPDTSEVETLEPPADAPSASFRTNEEAS